MDYRYLTYDERHTIEELYSAGSTPTKIAGKLKKSVSTIYNELRKGYTREVDEYYRPIYSAALAQQKTMKN